MHDDVPSMSGTLVSGLVEVARDRIGTHRPGSALRTRSRAHAEPRPARSTRRSPPAPEPPAYSRDLTKCRFDCPTREGVEHRRAELPVVAAENTQSPRERADPLPHRHFGEHLLDHVQRRVRHASTETGGAESAAFTRKRDKPLEPEWTESTQWTESMKVYERSRVKPQRSQPTRTQPRSRRPQRK